MAVNQIAKRSYLHRVSRRTWHLLSGAGAIDITVPTTLYTSTGAAQALTLADGNVSQIGFRKRILHAVDGGSGVLTAGGALHLGNSIATITLTNVRDWVELEWDGTSWFVIGYAGATFT